MNNFYEFGVDVWRSDTWRFDTYYWNMPHLAIEIARHFLQVGEPAQRSGLATQAKPASACFLK